MKLPLMPEPPPRRGKARAARRYWFAYSGGLDSTVLLQALAESDLRPLTAVHVHHGLQDAADRWASRARAECRRLGIPFRLLKVRIDPRHPAGPEASARAARYAALQSLMRAGDVLVTAHHRDDQAETVLLRVLRGTGVAGLAAIQPCTAFANGWLWRPFLDVPRERILAEALDRGLQWIEDPHNADPRYARSYLRQEILPRLQRHWPQAGESLARLAGHAAQAQGLLEELAQLDAASAGAGDELSVARLQSLSPARRANLLRDWLARRQGLPPSAALLERIERELLGARADAAPLLRTDGRELRRYRDRLLLCAPLAAPPPDFERAWDGRRVLRLPAGCGTLALQPRPAGLALTVRFARGGERLKPACGGPTRTLKNLFQEAGVPPWVRTRTPLIYENATLRCVGDYWCDPDWAARGLSVRWLVDLPGRTPRGESA